MAAARGRRSAVGVVEIARELGVSTATVSRALNGSAVVRPQLAERIRAHAKSRGYVPNRLARALSSSDSRAFVGFVIPYVDTPAYSAVAAECARLLSADSTQMILAITENDPRREFEQLQELIGTRTAGLVIAPSTHILPESRRLLSEIPVVELHRACGITAPGVFSDDEDAMTQSVAHVAELGHTEIGYIGTPRELSNGSARLRGVRRGMVAAGLDPDSLVTELVEPTHENGRAAAKKVLDGAQRITALIVGGGSLSVGVTQAVRQLGLRVPGELSLVVYGDPAWFALADPPLTMVRVSYSDLARRSARLLLDAVEARYAGSAAPAPGPHLVTPELRVAGSTAPPPRCAEPVARRRPSRKTGLVAARSNS